MVCSIGSPYSNLIDYAEENFVTKNQTVANSRWFGQGSVNLGLIGQVNSGDYQNVYRGLDNFGNNLRRQLSNKNSRPGRDLTFSAPKSVSLLALVLGNEQIIKAHSMAVNRALEYIEQNCIFTRTGAGGRISLQTKNMMVAIFQHHQSRNLEPNLHSHCVIFNQTQAEDGKWRAMDNRQLYQQRIAIGMVYHHELSQQLMELGYSINWNQDGTFDVAGFESSQLKQFSSRRAEIINMAGENSDAKTKARACVSTRNSKKYVNAIERITQKESWQHKLSTLNISVEHYSANNRQLFSRSELIDKSIKTLSERDGKTQFSQHELLKEVLIQAQGQHQLDQLQHDIKQHPSLIPTKNEKLTTIDLYRIERVKQRAENRQTASRGVELNREKFSVHEISDAHNRISQTVDNYLHLEDRKQSHTVILTDTQPDEFKLTSQIRQRLIQQNKLSAEATNTVVLQSKNLTKPDITNPQNYQVGDAIKFNRSNALFSNQHLYKVIKIDEKNRVLHLSDRFNNLRELPINRYQNREVFKVERRELRIGEKMRFNRSQYINGKQVSAGQSFVITDIKDKQKITIKTKGQKNIVKADNLFLSEYNYVNTLNKYQGKKIDSCIYYPSTDKSKQSFQQDIYSVASKTEEKLTVYTSDHLLSQNIKVKTNPYLDMESNQQPNGISKVQVSPNIQSENIQPSVSLNDNILFNIASSANHLVIDLGVSSNTDEQRVYHSPDGVMIETDPQNLSSSFGW